MYLFVPLMEMSLRSVWEEEMGANHLGARLVLAVDIGTSVVKAVAFDGRGRAQAIASRPLGAAPDSDDSAGQDMNELWDTSASCIAEVVMQLGDASRCAAVCVTGQGDGLWTLDAHGCPTGTAILWNDGRAAKVVEEIRARGLEDAIESVIGTQLFPGLTLPLLRAIKQSDFARYRRTTQFLFSKDWIRYKLTAMLCTDVGQAARSLWMSGPRRNDYWRIAELLEIPEAAAMAPNAMASSALGGGVSTAAARATGLVEGTPVAVGAIDVIAAGLGLGVTYPDEEWAILGTTGFVGARRDRAVERKSAKSATMRMDEGEAVVEFMVPMTGAPSLHFARSVLGLGDEPWHAVESIARRAKVGVGDVLFLPYGAPGGERSPFQNADASAAWLGLRNTTPRATLMRSAYEGIAWSLSECARALGGQSGLKVTGGGFSSDLLCELVADFLHGRVLRPAEGEASARGAAAFALAALGISENASVVSARFSIQFEEFEPRGDATLSAERLARKYHHTLKPARTVWNVLAETGFCGEGEDKDGRDAERY